MLMVMLAKADNTPAMTGSYFVQMLDGCNLDEDAMVVREGKQSIPLSSHEYSEIPSGALLGTSNGPTLPTTLENTGLQEPVKKSCVAPAKKGSQLDKDRGEESNRKEESPDTLGAHLLAPQRDSLKRVWLKLPKQMREIKFKLGGQGWKPKIIRRLGQVLIEYQHRFSKGQEDLRLYKNDPFEIKLKEDAKTPIVSRSYRYNPVVAREVNSIIEKYLRAGIIRRSQSPYAAPIVVVLKKNGGIRMTCDYRRLNEATVISQTPIPRTDELLDTLGSASFFSSFDMMPALHQIMIGENSVPLTAFCTTSGLYEFLVMPMGTSGSPGHFQRVMQRVTADLAHFVTIYIDDVLVPSNDESSMVDYIARFLKALTKHNLKISPSKSEIGAQEISFLGHTISPRGVKPDAKKVDTLRKLPMLNNVSELRSLLGGLSYYRKFLPNLSRRLRPITRLVKKDGPFSFDAEMEAVVRDILKVLTNPPVLVYPDFEAARNSSRKFRLYCDASAAGFGATLEQSQNGNPVRPIVYLSRTMLPNEQGWAPIEKEAGCIVWAIKRLRQYLFLIPFDIYTDHLPLTSLLCVGVSNARVQRWVEFLTAYNYRIIHRKGAAHGNADMLSRLCQPAIQAGAQGSCSTTNPEDHAVYFVGASGMWPRSIPASAFNVFIETGFARQRLGVGGLLNAPDYSYDKSRNQYVYHG